MRCFREPVHPKLPSAIIYSVIGCSALTATSCCGFWLGITVRQPMSLTSTEDRGDSGVMQRLASAASKVIKQLVIILVIDCCRCLLLGLQSLLRLLLHAWLRLLPHLMPHHGPRQIWQRWRSSLDRFLGPCSVDCCPRLSVCGGDGGRQRSCRMRRGLPCCCCCRRCLVRTEHLRSPEVATRGGCCNCCCPG